MTKYHVSRDGKVRPCRSKGACPLGSSFSGKGTAENYAVLKEEQGRVLKDIVDDKKTYSMEMALERGAFVDKTVTAQLESKKDTHSQFFDKMKGEYVKERQKIHREILDNLHKQHENVPENGQVVFSAGLPGAGKTTVLEGLKDREGVDTNQYVTVSSDDFKEIFAERGMIPEVDGLHPMEASTLVHDESSYLADKYLKELAAKNKNIVYDFTCKSYDSTAIRIKTLTNNGYDEKNMQFVFVDIPLEVAEERANFRYASGLNEAVEDDSSVGGRYLPKEVLYKNKSETGRYSSKNAEALLQVYGANKGKGMPEPIVYDNSGNKFVDPTYKPQKIEFNEFSSR